MKYTPGPWKCTNTSHHYYDYRIEGPYGQLEFTKEQGYANARLIAAAPDLYSALAELIDACTMPWMQKLLKQASVNNDVVIAINRAKLALAKANGE